MSFRPFHASLPIDKRIKYATIALKAQVKSRIVMTPEHAKRLAMALQDNLMRYEAQFGEIRLPERGGSVLGNPFKGEA